MSSPFIPDKSEETKEEPLQNLFEMDVNYKQSKKEGLKLLLQKIYPKQTFSEAFNSFVKAHKLIFGAGFASTIIVAGLIAAFLFGVFKTGGNLITGIDVSAAEIQIKAEKQNNSGIDPETKFTINTEKSITEKELRGSLEISPNIDYNLEKTANNTFELKPKQTLERSEVYQFNLKTLSNSQSQYANTDLKWAFQVQDTFRVVQTLPSDKSTNVSLDTGIEVTLNTDNFNNFEKYFEINPKIEGKFEKRGKTAVFIPANKLEKQKVYTVKVLGGLSQNDNPATLNQDYVFQFETTSGEEITNFFSIGKPFVEVTPNDNIVLPVLTNSQKPNLDLTIYTFKDQIQQTQALKKYATGILEWSRYAQTTNFYDTGDLNKVSQSSINIQTGDEKYLNLPDKLNTGVYVLEAKLDDKTSQILVQSTLLSGFLVESQNQSLLWLKDLETGKPLVKSTVGNSLDDKTLQSDDQGLVTLPTPKKNQNYFYTVTTGDRRLYLPVFNKANLDFPRYESDYYATNKISNYWSHLYTDRLIYKPADVIRFWGFVQKRDNSRLPEKLTAKITDNNPKYFDIKDNKVVFTKEISLDSGTFNSEIELSQFISNTNTREYYLTITDASGETIKSAEFNIANYVKPAYTISLNSDKKAYFVGETAKFSGKVNFFEGTPATNSEVKLTSSNFEKNVKTNQNGEYNAEQLLTLASNYYYTDSTRPESTYTTAYPSLSEEVEISSSVTPVVFKYRTNVDVKTTNEKETGKVQLKINQIDISRLNNGTAKDENDYLGAVIAGKNLNIRVEEYKYIKTETGNYYNFVTKKVEKNYTNNESFVKAQRYDNLKSDSEGKVNLEFKTNPDSFYKIYVEVSDIDQKPIPLQTTMHNNQQFLASGYYYLTTQDSKNYAIDEKIETVFKGTSDSVEQKKESSFLFLTYQQGLKKYNIQDNPNFSFNFSSDFLPNVHVQGVYFDGKNFKSTYPQEFTFDSETRKLNIEISTDKQNYKPQETVLVKAKVTDKDGKPVSAKVNLSVVDEAVMKIYNHDSNPLNRLYQRLENGLIYNYSSHDSPLDTGAQRGDGGGGGLGNTRTDFADTAFFKTLQTNDNGELETKFKVPDNLTSWRITAEAISPSLFAGSAQYNIKVQKPFFVDAVLNQTYLENDKPKIKLRAFGSELKDTDEVEYAISSESLKLTTPTLKSKGSTPVDVELDSLPVGFHKLKIIAASGELKDGIIREFIVLENYSQKNISQFYKFEPGTVIPESGSEDTTLTFSDQGRSKYYQNLLQLSSITGERSDQKLSRDLAGELLKTYFDRNFPSSETNYTDYQTPTGAIGIYPYAGDDLENTVWSLLNSASFFDTKTANNYLQKVIDSSLESRERKILVLTGQSGINKKVLIDFQNLAKLEDLKPLEKLHISLGLINSGDKENARKIYKNLLENYTISQNNTIGLNIGENEDQVAYATIVGAVVGSKLQEKEAEQMFDYSLQNPPKDILIYLQQIQYLQEALKNSAAEEVEFSYTIDGKTETKKLTQGQSFSRNFTSESLKNLNITVTKGKLGIVSSYQQSLSESDLKENSELSVTRKYFVNGIETNKVTDGNLVQIQLNYDIKNKNFEGCYNLSDNLPSGLKATTPAYAIVSEFIDNQPNTYPNQIDVQKVSFCVTKDNRSPIIYYARVISKGEFRADSAIIQSIKNPADLAITKPSQFIVE